MQFIKINPNDFSAIFWNKVINNAFLKQKTILKYFFKKIYNYNFESFAKKYKINIERHRFFINKIYNIL